MRVIALRAVVAISVAVLTPLTAAAQDAWVRVASPNFTVVTNASERDARRIATQFERIRAAITGSFPWAKAELDRRVIVVGAKDEATMRRLVPEFWEPGSQVKPSSVLTTGPDAHYIALRADVPGEDTPGQSPYQSAYWAYSALAIQQGFDVRLPLWFRNGLAGILSNSIVRNNRVEFGRPFAPYIQMVNTEGRLTTADLLKVDAQSDYYRGGISRQRFDAQSWAVMHYLLFGRGEPNADALNRIARMLAAGQTSAQAIESVFGSLDAFDQAYRLYLRNGILLYAVVDTQVPVAEAQYTAERLSPPAVQATEIGLHVAMNNKPRARALIAQAQTQAPVAAGVFDAEGALFDLEGNEALAGGAYRKAVDAGSTNFSTLQRLASIEWSASADAAALGRRQDLLARAVAANARYAPAHVMLAETRLAMRQFPEAVESARTAAALEPSSLDARVVLARALWATDRRDEARGQALAARALSSSDDERRRVQAVLDFFDRSTQAASGAPGTSVSTTQPAGTGSPAGATQTSSSGSSTFLLRPLGTGETRVLGSLQAIECPAGGVTLVLQGPTGLIRATAREFSDVSLVTFRDDTPSSFSCGALPRPLRALLTYRPDPSTGAGTAVAIELVPDDFKEP